MRLLRSFWFSFHLSSADFTDSSTLHQTLVPSEHSIATPMMLFGRLTADTNSSLTLHISMLYMLELKLLAADEESGFLNGEIRLCLVPEGSRTK